MCVCRARTGPFVVSYGQRPQMDVPFFVEASNGCFVFCGLLFWCTICRRRPQMGVSFSRRTAVLVYAMQTDFSDRCFVLAENSCFGVRIADGFLRWVFSHSRGGLSFWCTLCRRMGVSFSLTTFVLVYPFADRGIRWVFRSRGRRFSFRCTLCRRGPQMGMWYCRGLFCRVVCESLKINGCALLVDDVLRCILCGGHR